MVEHETDGSDEAYGQEAQIEKVNQDGRDSRRDRLSGRLFRSSNCHPLCAASTLFPPTRRRSDRPRSHSLSKASCRQTRVSIDVIQNFSTCHPLRSTGITRLRHYYEMIRLLDRRQPAVVSSAPAYQVGWTIVTSLGSFEISRGKTQ